MSTFCELSFALSGANAPSSTIQTAIRTQREIRPVVSPASAVISRPLDRITGKWPDCATSGPVERRTSCSCGAWSRRTASVRTVVFARALSVSRLSSQRWPKWSPGPSVVRTTSWPRALWRISTSPSTMMWM